MLTERLRNELVELEQEATWLRERLRFVLKEALRVGEELEAERRSVAARRASEAEEAEWLDWMKPASVPVIVGGEPEDF
jgi:septal ring factor EnvC (AmiA/AmiB activator)